MRAMYVILAAALFGCAAHNPSKPVTRASVAVDPNDPLYGIQWALPKIAAPTAWATTTGSSSVIIAVVSTGVDGTQPDLVGKTVPGWNIFDSSSNTTDVKFNGTAISGLAAANTNNAVEMVGVCWTCMVMPIRVSSTLGSATQANIAAGVTWAAQHGARVIVAGFQLASGGVVSQAAAAATNSVVIAAAGDSLQTLTSPDDPNILEIGASDQNDAVPSWSNRGPYVDLVAPGVGVETIYPGGLYNTATGTAFSAAHVAGVVGLMLAANPAATPAQVIAAIKSTADPLVGVTGSGTGRLNAAKAVTAIIGGSDTTPPTVSITSPVNGAMVTGTINIQATAADNVGVTSVVFSVDNIQLCTVSSAPYACPWNSSTVSSGCHTITATAKDAAGNNAASSVVVAASNFVCK